MAYDARFGLPLSLVEALRADPSPEAAALADLLDDEKTAPKAPPRETRVERSWQGALAAVGLLTGLLTAGAAAQGHAATPSLEGRWAMAPAQSSFREDLTGPAPDTASVIVTRDDPKRLTYELIERLGGAEIARGDYDLSFSGAASTASVDGSHRQVMAERNGQGDVVIRTPARQGAQVVIRLRRTGPDTAVIEHDVEAGGGSITLERISLVRTSALASNTSK